MTNDERDPELGEAPLTPEEARVERLLLDSARLDRAPDDLGARALDAGLGALERETRSTGVWLGTAAAAALAIAAGAAFLLSRPPAPTAPVVREPAKLEPPAGRPSAKPAPPPCRELVIARGGEPLLDDFETKDSRVAAADGRTGIWSTYDDGTGKQTPPDRSPILPSKIAGGRGESRQGLRIFGGKFTDWGVTFGAELVDAGCYDASAYAGIEFWARGKGTLKVGLQMIDVHDAKYGGFCQTGCYNTHRKVIELTPGWNRYQLRWEELRQLYEEGEALEFDPRRVRFLEFGLGPESTPFDVWLDDVAFIPR